MQIVEFYANSDAYQSGRGSLLDKVELDTFQSHKAREYIIARIDKLLIKTAIIGVYYDSADYDKPERKNVIFYNPKSRHANKWEHVGYLKFLNLIEKEMI